MNLVLDAAVITGAGRGLGRACALRLGALGLPVLCISRSQTALQTCEDIRKGGGQAEAIQIDLANPLSSQLTVTDWIRSKRYRRLGVLLSAGTLGSVGGILDSDPSVWAEAYITNVLGNLAVVKGLIPRMLDAKFGRIVGLAGGGAAYAYPRFSAYALSKVAMVRAMENLHEELAGKGNFASVCLAPGAMQTDMLDEVVAAGAEVRTLVPIDEPVDFVEAFFSASRCLFSGRYLHVRDAWRELLDSDESLQGDIWYLRRLEE